MSKIGKVVLVPNYSNPYVIIADGVKYPKALALVRTTDNLKRTFKLSDGDIEKLDYQGRKLENRSVELNPIMSIYNLKIREIGVLTEDTCIKLLRNFVTEQVSQGATNTAYLEIRDEVHTYLIKRMKLKTK